MPSVPPTYGSKSLNQDPRALLRHAHAAVRRRCPSGLHDRREDIAQALVVRLLTRVQAADGVTLTPEYVGAAAGRAVADAVRTSLRRRAFWQVNQPVAPALTRSAPRPDASHHRVIGSLRTHWRALDPAAAAAMRLYLEGESIGAIAAALGWNSKKASNTVFRTLARLRKRLAAEGITIEDLR